MTTAAEQQHIQRYLDMAQPGRHPQATATPDPEPVRLSATRKASALTVLQELALKSGQYALASGSLVKLYDRDSDSDPNTFDPNIVIL
ncbi:MAG: hypothetical protein QM572_05795 [Nocardioides sp.]|uniref:hypothetical protein n=1 Tax=Nocardioides sp. TaxID=35761 RepID=UPI0039E6CAE9